MDTTLETVAELIAAMHIKDGWNLKPDAYRIASFPEDEQALRARLGHVPTRLEIVYFERAVWQLLGKATVKP